MKNSSGITMMNLVLTVVVIVILTSVVGFYSIDTIRNSYIANDEKEFADVVNYTSLLKTKVLIEEISLPEETVISQDLLYTFENKLTQNQINKIVEVNLSTLDANYKYHFVDSERLADKEFSGGTANVKDAKNNYIINFYTGTVITLYESNNEVSGIVKGLADIMIELKD